MDVLTTAYVDQAVADAPLAPALARAAAGDLCAGCGVCAALAPGRIAMRLDDSGWLRPEQTGPVAPDEDAAIGRVCPGLGQRIDAAGRTDSDLWGPYVAMRVGWSTDPDLRHAGASGGGLSAVAQHLLATGTVDAVIATGADANDPVGNETRMVTDRDGVLAAAGSRYAPSSPLAGLHDVLTDWRATGRRVAVVGRPCDAAALAAWRAEHPDHAAAVPVVLSFFCAGTPARRGAIEVLAKLGAPEGQTQAFRYRGNGWPGRATATLADGRELSMSYHESWGGVLSRHVQHRCKICADGTGKAADLVCADAWESDARGYPVFEEAPGVSLIVTRTSLGERLLGDAVAAGRIETAPFDVGTLAAIQPGQLGRRRALAARLAALRLLGRPVPHYRGLHILAAARHATWSDLARNFVGTLRRALRH